MSKSLRLSFKGDKPEKRKKHKSGGGSSSSKKRKAEDYVSDVEEYGGDEQAWVPAMRIEDIAGPSFLFQHGDRSSSSSSAAFCLSFNTTLNALEAAPLLPPDAPSSRDVAAAAALEEVEGAEIVTLPSDHDDTPTPQSVHQVWVCSRIAGTSSFTLRSAEGKYLGADRYGVVKATAEARGPQEEWELVPAAPGSSNSSKATLKVALKSIHGGFLTLDEVAGGKRIIRSDAEAITERETWTILLQWSHRHKARYGDQLAKKAKGHEDIATTKSDALEKEVKLFKSRAGTGYMPAEYGQMSSQDRKALRKAQKEGRLAEEMLDRRTKYKSDKYAK